MADFALDCAADDVEHFEQYQDAPLSVQYEEGIIDEHGVLIGNPFSVPVRGTQNVKPSGPGNCPICGNVTIQKNGRFGDFYGCSKFPKCKGNRDI